jgi:hypothetical protein
MEVSGELHAPAALPQGEKPPVPIGWEAGWAPEPAWPLSRREKPCAPAGNRTPAVAMPTELSRPTSSENTNDNVLKRDQLKPVSKQAVGPSKPLSNRYWGRTGAFFLGDKAVEAELNLSPPSSSNIKNA